MTDSDQLETHNWQITVHGAMSDIDRNAWNVLVEEQDPPFIRHEFLDLLEHSESANPENGWIPCHLTIDDKGGSNNAPTRYLGACPAYFKQHSYGEYVFDWAWARAYQQHGLSYYPKIIVAVPFTPVTTRKFLYSGIEQRHAVSLLAQGLCQLAENNDASSVHVLFAKAPEIEALGGSEFLQRQDNQFHWTNQSYHDFDSYLAQLTSKKRKNIRHERRQISEQKIRFRWLHGSACQESDWKAMYRMYRKTTAEHGGYPYLSRDFFLNLSRHMSDRVLLLQGFISDHQVCSALYFKSQDALYGRYWGADGFYPQLHFETCYYQPIEYAINQGLARFEAGAQGHHKLSRGLMPTTTRSGHWLTHPEFHKAIDRYLVSERADVEAYQQMLAESGPFRK